MGADVPGTRGARYRRGVDRIPVHLQPHGSGFAHEAGLLANAGIRIQRLAYGADPLHPSANGLSPFAFRNAIWIRPIFYFVVIVAGLLNALGHTLATILGHTVNSVRFARPAPEFYSSPLLLAASIYALVQLRRTRQV